MKTKLHKHDYTNFLTKDNILFTIRGFYHPEELVRAVPCYVADENGDRYSKFLRKSFRRDIDEFGDSWLSTTKPNYLKETPLGKMILVPTEDIIQVFDPFELSKETKTEIAQTDFQKISNAIEAVGIPKEDIGVYGSYLTGFQNSASDIDVVIRGINNMTLAKENISKIRKTLCAKEYLDDKKVIATVEKYRSTYNPEKNDFSPRLFRRWSTLRLSSLIIKLMFMYKPDEVPKNLLPTELTEDVCVEGIVTNDEGTCFMPRHFTIRGEEKEYTVITYFYHFYFAVRNNDKVKVYGSLSKDGQTILLHDKNSHGIQFENGN